MYISRMKPPPIHPHNTTGARRSYTRSPGQMINTTIIMVGPNRSCSVRGKSSSSGFEDHTKLPLCNFGGRTAHVVIERPMSHLQHVRTSDTVSIWRINLPTNTSSRFHPRCIEWCNYKRRNCIHPRYGARNMKVTYASVFTVWKFSIARTLANTTRRTPVLYLNRAY